MIPRAAAQRKEEVSTRPWIYVRGVSVFPGVFLLFSMSSSSFFLLDLAGKNVKSRSQRSNYTARGQLRRDREFTNAIISIYKERERERERETKRGRKRERRETSVSLRRRISGKSTQKSVFTRAKREPTKKF